MEQAANDPRISDELLRQLTGMLNRGDCQDHYHSSDRQPSHDTLVGIQQTENVKTVTANYIVASIDDYLLVDTTSGNVTLTLPKAKNGRLLFFKKIVAANSMILSANGSDKIDGASTQTVAIQWTCIRLKAISGGWAIT